MVKGKIIAYAALFTKTEGKFVVEFPDLEGCFSQGDTLEEAICSAQGALAAYYFGNEGSLPEARKLESIKEENPDVFIQIVAVNTDDYIKKSVKLVNKTVTIPEWLNDLAIKYHVNFSRTLKTALIYYLRELDSVSSNDRKLLNE